MNFESCGECGLVDMPKEANRVKSGGDGVEEAEEVEFEHHVSVFYYVCVWRIALALTFRPHGSVPVAVT